MSSFLKIASGMLLPLSLALVGTGCLADEADDETDDATIAEAALLEQASTTTTTTTTPPDQTLCGPGNLIGSLPYQVPIPAYYGGVYSPGLYGATPYYGGGGWPGYSGYWGGYGAGYGYGNGNGGYYNPAYYGVPGAPGAPVSAGCGCPPP